ncbi:MAG: hypothetical protein QG611_271 [Bacteroidota bacterium]|nr:hypothetical protein [Bacteroidota bacterium]
MRKFIYSILILTASLSAYAEKTPKSPYGIWAGRPGCDMPFVRGFWVACKWAELEPEKGKFNWNILEDQIKQAFKEGTSVGLMVFVGPDSPEWIYSNGVPKVFNSDAINTRGVSHLLKFPYYPYYLDPDYINYWYKQIRTTGDWIASLPDSIRKNILLVQTAEGTTGDEGPYKGIPFDTNYRFSEKDQRWIDLKINAWRIYKEIYSNMNPPIQLLINSGNSQQYEGILDTLVPDVWKKSGHPGHIYQFNGEKTYYNSLKAQLWKRNSTGEFRRFRSEMDETTNGWFRENHSQNMYWLNIFCLHYGLDILRMDCNLLQNPVYRPGFEFFSKYAGQKDPKEAIGAFSAMKDVLDASDKVRFPENKYGKANSSNKDRFLAIVKDYEKFGARIGDLDHAVGGAMNNRTSSAINDVGYDLLEGNYEVFLKQLAPNETSMGWWNIGPADEPYGRFARSFDYANRKNTMYFAINKDFFIKQSNKEVTIRIVYLDKGLGKWSLQYDSVDGNVKTASTVSNTNSGKWKEIKVDINDGRFTGNGPNGSDLILNNESKEDSFFHMVELMKR